MSTRVTCPDSDALVSYLYGEFEAGRGPDRQDVARHLAECATCASEVAALGGVREQLSAWTTPEVDLGFEVVQAPRRASRRFAAWLVWPSSPLPIAAAAVLVLGASAGLARLDIQYDTQGLRVRTGWGHASQQAAAPAGRDATPLTKADLVAFERQMRREVADNVKALTVVAGDPAPATVDPALLKRVRQIIEESEVRQQQNLQLRVTELARDFQMRRQADLVQIEQGFGRIAGDTAQQRQILNQYLRNVSTTGTPPQ
jgi:hypothetical protein